MTRCIQAVVARSCSGSATASLLASVLGRLAILAHPDILLELRERGVEIDRGDLDVGLPMRRVLAICDDVGIACIDPTSRLRPLGRAAFFPRDEHPTAAGHRALAEALLAAREAG